ncbi:MAG: hypothetical protein FJ137_11700 [Deltaproteobacteria bacterium]|nr:hypothetical protein [Deltaproteobacteria bacterium]
MFGIGMSEMIIICVVALLVFGPDELPAIVKKIARGVGEARRVTDDLRRSIDLVDDAAEDRRARAFARSPTAASSPSALSSSETPSEAARPDEPAVIPGSVLTPVHGDDAPVIAAPAGRVSHGDDDRDDDRDPSPAGAHGTHDAVTTTAAAPPPDGPAGGRAGHDDGERLTTNARAMGR